MLYQLGRVTGALAIVAVVVVVAKAGLVPWLTRRIGAVGQTALSNYLFTSISCSLLFNGFGAGPLRQARVLPALRHRRLRLGAQSNAQPSLASLLPVRPDGVGLAFAHLLETPADETRCRRRAVDRGLTLERVSYVVLKRHDF